MVLFVPLLAGTFTARHTSKPRQRWILSPLTDTQNVPPDIIQHPLTSARNMPPPDGGKKSGKNLGTVPPQIMTSNQVRDNDRQVKRRTRVYGERKGSTLHLPLQNRLEMCSKNSLTVGSMVLLPPPVTCLKMIKKAKPAPARVARTKMGLRPLSSQTPGP